MLNQSVNPISAFIADYDEEILINNDELNLFPDEEILPPIKNELEEELEEDFPDFMDNDWSWLQ